MAVYEITAPDGTVFEVTAPDDATEGQVLQYAQSNFQNAAPEAKPMPNLIERGREMVGNIPRSGKQYIGNIWEAVTDPVNTIPNIAGLGVSAVGHGLSALGADIEPRVLEPGSQFAEGLKNRYGSLEKAGNTLVEDPVGFAADIAGALTGAGVGLKALGLPTAARAATYAGNVLDPLATGVRAVKGVGKASANIPGVKQLPEKLYQGAAKFKDTDIMQEALKRGVNPGKDLEMLVGQKRAVGATIGDIVNASNESIPASDLFIDMQKRRGELATPGIVGAQERRAFDKFVRDLEIETGLKPAEIESTIVGPNGKNLVIAPEKANPSIHVQDVQEFKKDAYKRLYGDRNRIPEDYAGRARRGAEQAKLQASQNAKAALERVLGPEYAKQNAEYGFLSDLVKEVEPISKRIGRTEEALSSSSSRFGTKSTAIGMAAGRPDIGLVGAAGAGLGRLYNSPSARISAALKLGKARDLGLIDFLRPQAMKTATLTEALNALERDEQERRKQRLRSSGSGR